MDEGGAATINGGHTRIANCECGAQLAGGSKEELFEAVQRHVAHHHPQLLGALELDLVNQMAENVEGH
jgi:predicted small metal-binding protein